jgi:hypothetical protein
VTDTTIPTDAVGDRAALSRLRLRSFRLSRARAVSAAFPRCVKELSWTLSPNFLPPTATP